MLLKPQYGISTFTFVIINIIVYCRSFIIVSFIIGVDLHEIVVYISALMSFNRYFFYFFSVYGLLSPIVQS